MASVKTVETTVLDGAAIKTTSVVEEDEEEDICSVLYGQWQARYKPETEEREPQETR